MSNELQLLQICGVCTWAWFYISGPTLWWDSVQLLWAWFCLVWFEPLNGFWSQIEFVQSVLKSSFTSTPKCIWWKAVLTLGSSLFWFVYPIWIRATSILCQGLPCWLVAALRVLSLVFIVLVRFPQAVLLCSGFLHSVLWLFPMFPRFIYDCNQHWCRIFHYSIHSTFPLMAMSFFPVPLYAQGTILSVLSHDEKPIFMLSRHATIAYFGCYILRILLAIEV